MATLKGRQFTPKDTNENDKRVSKELKTKENLKGGNPNEVNNHGRDLIEQGFSSI